VSGHLLAEFPRLLADGCEVTSEATPAYNCIAWAASDESRWWWPDEMGQYHWPDGVPREATLTAFEQAFALLGYQRCDEAELEPHLEKIAVYVGADGAPTHAVRQLPSGQWTSKLGRDVDISHGTPSSVEGPGYGRVALFMCRPSS